MSFSDELRQMSSYPVNIVLERVKDLLRQKAENGVETCRIEQQKFMESVLPESVPESVLEGAFEILRQEGVEVEMKYGYRPGESNFVTFSWA